MTVNPAFAAGPAKLRPGITVFPLDQELVVFSEERQLIVGLNAPAAFVFRELEHGAPVAEIVKTVTSAGLAGPLEAERWVATTLEALRSHGMLADGQAPVEAPAVKPDDCERRSEQAAGVRPYAPFSPAIERRYRLLETCLLIRFGHPAQLRLVDSVIGHLVVDDSSAPTIVLDIAAMKTGDGHLRSDIYRNGEPVGCAPRLSELGPIVKSVLWQSAVNAHDFFFYIHAGVVGAGKGCVLLPAAAGSGKSSLTAALAQRGFRYYSDEVALIEPITFRVPPVPLAICVKSTGWDVMAKYYPVVAEVPTHRRGDGKVVRYIAPPAGAVLQPPAKVRHIVFPRHANDARTELRPISRSDAIGRLMGECLALSRRLDQDNVGQLVRWVAGIDCYTLEFSALDEAVELVTGVAPSKAV